jgi:polyisoprenoid-binding protein YceI
MRTAWEPTIGCLRACALTAILCAASSVVGAQTKPVVNLDWEGVGIHGYDPVVYFTEGKAVKGECGATMNCSNRLPGQSCAMNRPEFRTVRVAVFGFPVSTLFPQVSQPQAPVYEIAPVESSITFDVESSVAIKGTFSKWDATLTFQSRELSTGVLDIKIQADSVDTGSGLKNGKLRGKNFFNSKEDRYITFRSTKINQTGPASFEVEGDFTIRGVTKKEKLLVSDEGKGSPAGTIIGTMAFDRKEYGMNSGIPFIKIANRVQVSVNLKWKRVSGPPPAFEQ